MAADLEHGTMAPGWWERGLDDLSAAETLAEQNFSGPWVIAYHAQQAAEKLIKAHLLARGMSSDTAGFRTHEIDDLRGLVAEWDDELAPILR